MKLNPRFTAILLFITLAALPIFGPPLSAQSAPPPTAAELDQLLAPVALYPDSLLSQITTASTNPQEILDVDNWLSQNTNLTGTALTDAAQQQGFDPAFIALVNFPDVLAMMADHIDDYSAIGVAFSADQGAVSASIQRLRDQAYNAGTLQTTQQQQVEVQQAAGKTIYVIQPANPQIVYVPVYDPTIVYVRPIAPPPTPFISFGIGIGIGALVVTNQPWGWGGWGWNWGVGRPYYNRGYWGGWASPYRPPNYWYRPRPVVWSNRPGYGGNWRYRPNGYRPPRPGYGPGHSRPPYGPGNRPGRPSTQPVKPGQPNRPIPNRPGNPGTRPTPPSTQPTRPTRPGNPGTTPTRPSRPSNPGTNPPAQPTKPGNPGTTPTRPSRPSNPGTNPPAQPGHPPSGRPGTNPSQPNRPSNPGQTKPTQPGGALAQPTRPNNQGRPAGQPAPQGRPQSQKPPPQPKPAPKPDPNKQSQPNS